jgi:hypothetical protein
MIDATVPAAGAGSRDIVVTAPGTTALSAPFALQAASAPATPVAGVTPVTGATVLPAADGTATRGLNIQTAVQATKAAPSKGLELIPWLFGSLILSLAAAAAVVLRKRRV